MQRGGVDGALPPRHIRGTRASWCRSKFARTMRIGRRDVNGYTSCYEIMLDDATYGGDNDLDLRYRLYVKTGLTTITVKTKPIYASSGNGNWAGLQHQRSEWR